MGLEGGTLMTDYDDVTVYITPAFVDLLYLLSPILFHNGDMRSLV